MGASNFWTMDNFPLLVFKEYDVVYDEAYEVISDLYADDEDVEPPEMPEFDDAFDEAADGICVLDEEEIDELKGLCNRFNREMNSDDRHDSYEEADCDVQIKWGYYEGGQLWVADEKYLDDWQINEINSFLKEMKREFGLTQLGVSWRASNGETGYSVVKENYRKRR